MTALLKFLTNVFDKGGLPSLMIVAAVVAVFGLMYWVGRYIVLLLRAKTEESKEVRRNLEVQNNMLIGELKQMTGQVMETNGMHAKAFAAHTENDHKRQAQNIEAQRAIQHSCQEITVTQRQIATDFSEMKGWIQAQP